MQETDKGIVAFYQEAKDYVLKNGYKDEVEWCKQRKSFESCDPETFFLEYCYVVLNAGMKEQAGRTVRLQDAIKHVSRNSESNKRKAGCN